MKKFTKGTGEIPLRLSPSRTATEIRKSPSTVTGGYKTKNVDKVLRGTDGIIPKEIADRLRGQKFNTFDDFRKAFWTEMSNSKYANEFIIEDDLTNIYRMKHGGSPAVLDSEAYKSRFRYELHHRTPINQGGAVYDLDNLLLVTPRSHYLCPGT
ncbi:HNH endonuclease [Paenibacillus apiarius]|uniref:HNH endonuclease n=1 Tax=Paenibacillus apiarius TaxID=46240 RepID=A0ABT4E198_9BACL|nr:HNH endonuclease [Paenibacillus apiarius]MCY9517921.1 HNH endonuclease [Paenibacillus apiarius]MCY9523384.1 HNH endonuclease [Paenibacillus apiarius]MCY9555557.1 HNH endonuclease [Paenibacillus apiarius]MCY9561564.1 HNH endonuclease [Paenibacillus apiarius]MCY9687157.1 HNH endonuclease [Paenibacillus apiarius]